MKIVIHPEILDRQRYSCNCCGQGCRSFLVPVKEKERQTIEQLRNWREQLGVGELYVQHRAAGGEGYGLNKREDGRCVFLDNKNLCSIHKLHGLKSKPVACQLYPFVFTPWADELRVGLRFDCPGVCSNQGKALSTYKTELSHLAKQLMPGQAKMVEPPPIRRGQNVTIEQFDYINEILLQIVTAEAMELRQRLLWLHKFVDHLDRIKWQNVGEEDFTELMKMIQGGLLAEVQREVSKPEAVAGKPRKLLGQFFFLLCHPTTIITSEKNGLTEIFKKRIRDLKIIKNLGQVEGPLPKLQPDWPECDLRELEKSFGDWPVEVDQMLTRYLVCRIAGMGYCGPNFYNYGLVEGVRSMLLAVVTCGWLMRIEAVMAGRNTLAGADAEKAVMTIDGNLGYASALGSGPARLRLSYLSDYLEKLLIWYCH